MASIFSRFNPTPAFPPFSGPYQVGTVDFEIAASELQGSSPSEQPPLVPTVAFRVFYPCDPPSKPSAPVYWVQSPQKNTLSAYIRFGGANSVLANIFAYFPRLLYYISLPAHRDAPILQPPRANGRWPLVVFSHGLGGSRNSYSHICGSLASYGLVVVATEHRDGSCPISYVRATDTSPAHAIDYNRYSHKPSDEVYHGRDEQLRIRLWEMNHIYEALRRIDTAQPVKNLNTPKCSAASPPDTTSMFHTKLDLHTPGHVTWAGHSFGATTTTQFVKSIFHARHGLNTPIYPHPPPPALESQITPHSPTILLDLWALPLNSPATTALKALPLPCFTQDNPTGGSTVLSVLSDAFAHWTTNLADVKATLSDPLFTPSQQDLSLTNPAIRPPRPAANIFYPQHSAHLSQSDFGILFPRVTRYVAHAMEPERTLRLNVRAILQVLRNAGLAVAPTSAEDMEVARGVEGHIGGGGLTHARATEKGDWLILNRRAGLVRGWVALSADEAGGALAAAEKVLLDEEDDDSLRSDDCSSRSLDGGAKVEEAMGDAELQGAATR